MNKLVLPASVLVLLLIASGTYAQGVAPAGRGGLIPPPAISMPYGGRIVTDINISDDDVLGIIKQIIPAVGEVIGAVAPLASSGLGGGQMTSTAAAAASSLDFTGFSEAISGVKNVRVVVAVYSRKLGQEALLKDLDSGVVKLGKFSRVIGDFALLPGALAVYAEADNGGYVGYAYDSRGGMLYAARVVGFVDVPKLTKWGMDAMKILVKAATPKPVEMEQPEQPEPPDTAPVSPDEQEEPGQE